MDKRCGGDEEKKGGWEKKREEEEKEKKKRRRVKKVPNRSEKSSHKLAKNQYFELMFLPKTHVDSVLHLHSVSGHT